MENGKKCNKWMRKSCFLAKTKVDQAKKEFLKYPSNMERTLTFMNVKKKCKKGTVLN